MKKKFIIYSLFLSGSFFFSLSIQAQAQQQQKPSERSFATEINKVKQIQAARNTQISKMQQPTDNTVSSQEPVKTENSIPANKTTTKPSNAAMRQPQKPVVQKNN